MRRRGSPARRRISPHAPSVLLTPLPPVSAIRPETLSKNYEVWCSSRKGRISGPGAIANTSSQASLPPPVETEDPDVDALANGGWYKAATRTSASPPTARADHVGAGEKLTPLRRLRFDPLDVGGGVRGDREPGSVVLIEAGRKACWTWSAGRSCGGSISCAACDQGAGAPDGVVEEHDPGGVAV